MDIISKNQILKDVTINVILGFGFRHKVRLMKLINLLIEEGYQINIIEKTDFISRYVVDSDFVISSNGRTIFEIASLGIPIIALSVNARETEHSFVNDTKTGYQINTMKTNFERELIRAISKISTYGTRKKFYEKLEKIDVRNGIERVVDLINSVCDKKRD
jgi:spore coat polysaccharide biosynthesis predicted glycosyltransferase SpsG